MRLKTPAVAGVAISWREGPIGQTPNMLGIGMSRLGVRRVKCTMRNHLILSSRTINGITSWSF